MHLVCLCLEGRPLPVTLPLSLVPPNKRGGISEPLAIMPPPSLGPSSPSFHSSSNFVGGGFSPPSSILVSFPLCFKSGIKVIMFDFSLSLVVSLFCSVI